MENNDEVVIINPENDLLDRFNNVRRDNVPRNNIVGNLLPDQNGNGYWANINNTYRRFENVQQYNNYIVQNVN